MKDQEWRAKRHPRSFVFWGVMVVVTAACTPPGLPAPIAPAASSAASIVQPPEPSVTIGVDGTVEGFNPHAIADYSLADEAVAQLVLPSVSTVAADGTVALNPDVVTTAEVTSTNPFTVVYLLDRDAAWSDGTPITGEDFTYLRDQMLIQPGTVDPAGYRLISGIVSRDAGKTVAVTFTQAVPDWKTLFSPLLPSHILKDAPGGWTEGLATGLPVSGNRYKMEGFDAVTGEITLVRNDKYWGQAPAPATAILRIGTAAALTAALGRGDLQAVLLQPDRTVEQSLTAQVPAARRAVVPMPVTVQLVFNTVAGPAADLNVRRAIAAALDEPALRAALDGGDSAIAQPVPSLVTLGDPAPSSGPSSSGPSSSRPSSSAPSSSAPSPRGSRTAAALADLTAAGYQRESLYMSKAGEILRLVLAYPGTDTRIAAAAALVQTQLAAVGIEVDLVRDDRRSVVNSRLARGTADLGLVMVPRGPSDALAAASAYGCPLPTAAKRVVAGADPRPRAGNLSGICTTEIQALLDQATAGAVPASLESALSSELPVIQLSRPSAIFAASPRFAGTVPEPGIGLTFSGPLSRLPGWPSS